MGVKDQTFCPVCGRYSAPLSLISWYLIERLSSFGTNSFFPFPHIPHLLLAPSAQETLGHTFGMWNSHCLVIILIISSTVQPFIEIDKTWVCFLMFFSVSPMSSFGTIDGAGTCESKPRPTISIRWVLNPYFR